MGCSLLLSPVLKRVLLKLETDLTCAEENENKASPSFQEKWYSKWQVGEVGGTISQKPLRVARLEAQEVGGGADERGWGRRNIPQTAVCGFLSRGFSYPWSTTVRKQMILPLSCYQNVSSSLALRHNAYVTHLTSSRWFRGSCLPRQRMHFANSQGERARERLLFRETVIE